MEYDPLKLVTEDTLVPFTRTATEGSVSPFDAEVTVPVTVLCAKAGRDRSAAATKARENNLCFIGVK
jgi:hypothetical protein